MWEMIDFHAIGHMPNTASAILKVISYKAYLVTSLYETLSKLIAMSLNSAKFWEGKVSTDQYTIFL